MLQNSFFFKNFPILEQTHLLNLIYLQQIAINDSE